ncbi:uncharacterized protein LOC127003719 isoform X1 [Eriocheir sinensis]|uniref:uncharacterized protein LOC127003719 isoform X1 n=3 Tax=Eriocheir sinensis TaxID=95602 RepID=UPI0021C7FE3F|nr:uncharacterized protein LOC127003719 isoform X1 [Eriocheir sinensis]
MVEGRWRNMVTLFKTMVDHNSIPNVEPQVVAYKEDLEELVKYVPQRRNNYEKKVGRSVKMERFPSKGCRILLQAYKDCMSRFVDPKIDNRILWDEITKRLEDEGLCFTTFKLKETFTGMIKGFEKCQHHNSLPGAIRRDVPYYRELAEVYGVYGRWPHVQTSRTMEMRTKRKYRLRLQVSQQLWCLEESRALLQVYPDVLESHVNQCLSHQPSDLWLQVAKVYSTTGYPKRDIPEIAVHIGLLRQGYAQNNKFPFSEEMKKVKETEEAVCYSPDVSKYTGEVEITYWSHEAVNLLLDLYIKHQSATASHANRNEVFVKINESLQNLGYKYSKEEVHDQFKFLLTQYNTRQLKPWMLPPVGRQTHNPVGAPYLEKLQKVLQLRREMSLSWTTGVKPLTPQTQKILLRVVCQKADELLIKMGTEREKKILLGQIIDGVIGHIRTHKLIDPVPRTRQVRLHIADAMKNFNKATENKDIAYLHKLFKDCNVLDLMCNISLEPTSSDYRMKSKRENRIDTAKNGTRMEAETSLTTGSCLEVEEDLVSNANVGWISEEHSCQELDEVAEYLTFALCHLCKAGQDHNLNNICKGIYAKPENSIDISSILEMSKKSFQNVKMLDSIYENSVNHDYDDVSNSFKSQLSSAENVENNLEISGSSRSTSRCSSAMCKNGTISSTPAPRSSHQGMATAEEFPTFSIQTLPPGTSDVYGKVFGKVQSGLPINSIRQHNNMLSTILCDSDLKLSLFLPNELTPHMESVLVNEETPPVKHFKQRDDKKVSQEHLSSHGKTSIPNDSSKQDKLNLGDKHLNSVLLNEELTLETKIIQTRSGRKTRFTFFSQTLNDDVDGKVFERSELHDEDVASPTKRIKFDPEAHNYDPSKKKRGRPRKVSHENLAHDCVVTKDDVPDMQSYHPNQSSFLPHQKTDCNSKMSSLKNPFLSFIKSHHMIKTTQENEIVKTIKEHKKEHTNILEEIYSILEDLDHHH